MPRSPGTQPSAVPAEDRRRYRKLERHSEELERLNELILSSAGEGIYGLDAEGLTTFVNPAATKMLGWPAKEIIGHPMHSLLHHSRADGSAYPREDCPIYAAFNDGLVHSVDNDVFWRKDGSSFPVEYTSTPICDEGKLIGAVVVFRSLTERKRSEEELRLALAEVKELKNRLEAENLYLQEEIKTQHSFDEIVGESTAIKTVLEAVETVAPTQANVIISGETGTGKELVARALHRLSSRRDKTLIKVNCASIPKELFESEFFGHVKGAFTGALRNRAGRFELADQGTLFLDEVGEIPLEMQSKLLQVLQEGRFERIGDERTRRVDVRIIAATNRDLKREVQRGRFRTDLYYRLNVFPIEVPPLRDREQDASLLAAYFLERSAKELNRSKPRLTPANIDQLQRYEWPGNVRELRNVIERALISSRSGPLRLGLSQATENFLTDIDRPGDQIVSEVELQRLEVKNMEKALKRCGGRIYGKDGAAALLGVRPTTLASRLQKMGINRRQPEAKPTPK